MASYKARILILCKTYPSPSGKHVETSCVAGMTEAGKLIRLFPVPFRLINDSKRFRKWQWIEARIEKAPADHRPESHRIKVDTIECDPEPISTRDNWRERQKVLEPINVHKSFNKLDQDRLASGVTLGLLQPSKIISLDITPASSAEWTDEERKKLEQNERQSILDFGEADSRTLATLRKLPFAFHYNYECEVDGIVELHRHKIEDWEVGALYWNCRHKHGNNWEQPFRDKIFRDLVNRNLMFLMGTMHRFPKQWLIVSLIYPPRASASPTPQQPLLI